MYLKQVVPNLPGIMNKFTHPGAHQLILILKFIKLRTANMLLFH
jgi:hypothetical protein